MPLARPEALALYHWALGEFDAEADWLAKAIDQHDPYGGIYLRVWYGRELRSTPRWAGLDAEAQSAGIVTRPSVGLSRDDAGPGQRSGKF